MSAINQRRLEVAKAAAHLAAKELMARRDSRQVTEKGPRDLVTDADVAAQQAIRRCLQEAFPEDAFMGEEEGETEPPAEVRQRQADAPACWIVDPLDGTVNYVHRLQSFAVSIGLYAEGQLQVGVIYDPVCDELFAAARGDGATCNGQALKRSDCAQLDRALIACSFAARVAEGSQEIDRFVRMLPQVRSIRRLGSCALNLCYVAAGRLDGYWAASVKTWDCAAGVLIAREAGAQVTAIDGGPFDLWQPRFCAAGTEGLSAAMTGILGGGEMLADR